MVVSELIEFLKDLPQDAKVRVLETGDPIGVEVTSDLIDYWAPTHTVDISTEGYMVLEGDGH